MSIRLPPDFDSDQYLAINQDVSQAVESGTMPSAEIHYLHFGRQEGRAYRVSHEAMGPALERTGETLFRYRYGGFSDLPAYEFATGQVEAADREIGARLIAAWHHAKKSNPGDPEGMWRDRLVKGGRLSAALEARDPDALVRLLSTMFQEHLTHGLAMGRATATVARVVPHRFAAIWTDRLLRLGEAVGILSVRSPEQSDINAPLAVGDIVGDVERVTGMLVRFPQVGAPYGVRVRGEIFPEHALTHLYAAWRVGQQGSFKSIIEIGGGYGGLCAALSGHCERYTIYDLPYTNLIQSYFLIKAGLPVSLAGEAPDRIRCLPWWEIDAPDVRADLVINQDSIPEMPVEAGRRYAARIKQIAPLFYSINQEATALNTSAFRQLRVPDLIHEAGDYRRLSRNLFWLRDGYVEEWYATEKIGTAERSE